MPKKILVNVNGNLRNVKRIFVNVDGILKSVKSGFVNINGILRQFFALSLTPSIQTKVKISKSGDYHNSSNIITLTGTKYNFKDANVFSYRFYRSEDQVSWTPMTTETITSNPPLGSSSTVTYDLTNSDFTATTMYFRFDYTATNTTYNTTTTSQSDPISVMYLEIPAPPSGFPNINQSTISVASTASSGTWTGSPTLYDWKWQYGPSNLTLTYQATPSVSSISLSGTTATVTCFNHGFKSGDLVSISGANSLFNQSATAISSVLTNLFSYTVSKTAWSFLVQYSIGNHVTYNGIIYRALLATPSRSTWSFTTNYTVNQHADYNNQLYRATVATPSPRASWSSSTSYVTNQYVNYNNTLWQCTLSNTGQAPFEGSIYWSSINIYPGGPYWTLIDIYPTSTTYWQSEQDSTVSSGTATGPNYHEGATSSPLTYPLISFPSTDYKTGTSLLSLTTRLALTVYNQAFNASANSTPRTIYEYPLILLGAITLTPTTASIVYSDAYMSVYDIDVKRQIGITSATLFGSSIVYTTASNHTFSSSTTVTTSGFSSSAFNVSNAQITSSTSNTFTVSNTSSPTVTSATVSGSNIIYTTSGSHGLSSGASVTITGMIPSTFNVSNSTIISTTSNTFTVSNSLGAVGSSTPGFNGTISCTITGAGSALATISTYPKINQANSSPISVTGLTGGGTYTVYVTPKNADSPRVSGVQRTATFTTPSPPVNTVAPTIGPLNNRSYLPVSTQLTSTTGTWTNVNASTTYNYNFQYFESAQVGWVSLQSSSSPNYTPPSNYTTLYGTQIRCTVTATNSDGSNDSSTSIAYNIDAAVSVGTISPTSVTPNTANNFSFSVSNYPTDYTINWGDTSNSEVYNVSSNTATVNASHSHTYATAGSYTLTVIANPGGKSNSATITVQEAAPGPVRNLTRVSDALAGVATDKKFTWDAPNTGGSVSKYQHKINSGSWIDVPGGGTQTFVELYSFNTGISNTVSIRAVGPGGNGAATDSGPFTLPVIATGPSYSSITSSQATVSWTSSNQSTYSLAITSAPATPYTGTTQTSRTISSLTANTAYSGSLVLSSSTSDTHTKSVSFTTLRTALTPTFGTNTRTADGFTGSVTNFDSNYTWNITTSAGSVAFGTATGATRPFTVTGVSAGSSATVTVTTSRTGYDSGSATTTESALNAALTPTFGTLTRGNGRIDSSVSNYSASYTWSGSASVGTFTWGTPSGSSYPFSVTGLSDDQSTTVTITTTRSGYVNGSATQTGSSLATGLTPTFGTNTSGSGSFAGSVTNYNSDYSWSMSASVGTFTWGTAPANNPGTRTFTVTGLTSAQSSTVTATTTRTGFKSASATTTGAALTTGLTPTFGTNTRTSDGFTGSVNNYSSSYTWSISTSAGSVAFGTASGSSYPFTVTGLSANTSATVTVTTSRTGYTSVSATTTESSLLTGLTPTFGTNTRGNKKIDGSVSNYSSSYTWSGSASNGTFTWGTVSGSTYPFSVTSLTDGQSTTVTVTTSRTNYTSVSATTTESALNAGLTPTFGANASAVGGFSGSVTNYNSDYSWSSSLDPTTATFTWGTAPQTNPGTRTFTVSGLSAGASGTLTLTTTRSGYNSGSASTTGTAQEGLTVPGVPSMVYDSVNNTATNYAYDISWTASSGSGTIVYQLECQPSTNGSTANGQPTVIRPSTGSYSTNSAQNVLVPKTSGGVQNLYWRARARASNDNGSTWTAWSSYASSFS